MFTKHKRLIIIGDVHGCLDELKLLLDKCGYRKDNDLVVFVGDIVGKGPKSVEAVEYVRNLEAPCIKGNHEHYLLEWRENVRIGKAPNFSGMGSPTHRQAAENLTEAQWSWMESLPYYIEFPQFNTVVVHAGFAPGIPFEQQDPETLMYIRSIKTNGEISSKIEPDAAPWASCWTGPHHVVFGHDARRGIQEYPYATGLDTGCCYGRQLSALIVPDRHIVNVNAREAYAPMDLPLLWS